MKDLRESLRSIIIGKPLIEGTIGSKPFSALQKEKRFGMVLLGAGGDLNEWVEGVAGNLIEKGIVSETDKTKVFAEAYTLSGNIRGEGGRTDLVLIFSETAQPDVGMLAMWRLQFGDCSWIEDFIPNYGKDYGSEATTEWNEEEDEDSEEEKERQSRKGMMGEQKKGKRPVREDEDEGEHGSIEAALINKFFNTESGRKALKEFFLSQKELFKGLAEYAEVDPKKITPKVLATIAKDIYELCANEDWENF